MELQSEMAKESAQKIAECGEEQVREKGKKLNNYMTSIGLADTLHQKSFKPVECKKTMCMGSLMSGLSAPRPKGTPYSKDELMEQATDFLAQYYDYPDRCPKEEHSQRLDSVLKSIRESGTYDLTYDELCFGTKTAWRNAPRCIGRMHWNKLHVFDCRDVRTTDEMFQAICRHIKEATNSGNIKSVITVFPKRVEGKPDFRVWNPHLVSYAGYQQDDGSVIGDPAKVKLTQICEKLGWKGKGGRFDILPLVLNASGTDPKYYEIPSDLVLEVELKHPEFDWFQDMGLRWYALPAVSDMIFDIGGIEFPAAPFNGWYMSSEIGGRNLSDRQRYNITEEVAVKMGLDTTSTINLWKDQAFVEVNRAVIHSFQSQNVTIVDHHTASENFIKHMHSEQKLRGGCPADWVWIVPPISSGLTQVFHQEMLNYNLKPSYEYQEKAWLSHVWINKQTEKELKESGRKIRMSSVAKSIFFASYLMNKYMKQRTKATVLYATETGKSEAYANRIGAVFRRAFNSEVRCMDKYDAENIDKESLVIVVTSTFGSGDAPDNGKNFAKKLAELRSVTDINNNNQSKSAPNLMANSDNGDGTMPKTKFAVFALGSSAYPDFCAFGKNCDSALDAIGCERLLNVATADELKGEEQCFKKWAQDVFKVACKEFNIHMDSSMDIATEMEENELTPDVYRLSRAGEQLHDLYEGLSKLHRKKVLPCRMTSRVQLQSPQSSRQTILARFDTKGAEDLQYSPGDHVGVLPTNRPELVSGIARRLKNVPSLNDLLLMQTIDKDNSKYGRVKTWKDVGRLPPCSITTALSYYLDITAPPTQNFLKVLAKSASDDDQKMKLEQLSNDDDMYETWKNHKYPNLLETLEEFDSVRLDAAVMLRMVPIMQPRFYSISSSPVLSHGEIHVTVGVVTYKTQDGTGPTHYGVCSTFLNSFPTTDVPCFIRRAPNFHMPEDSSRPIIMVGPGTGIAPFRGFLQQRQYDMPSAKIGITSPTKTWLNFRNMFDCNSVSRHDQRFGKMTLFFGCRHPAIDDIYRQELAALSKELIGFESHVAYSRLSGKPKTYVQDLLRKDGANIYRQLIKEQGHVYICGDAAMASDVRNVLKDILETYSHNMSSQDVNNYVVRLKDEGRFHEDIFGVLIKSK